MLHLQSVVGSWVNWSRERYSGKSVPPIYTSILWSISGEIAEHLCCEWTFICLRKSNQQVPLMRYLNPPISCSPNSKPIWKKRYFTCEKVSRILCHHSGDIHEWPCRNTYLALLLFCGGCHVQVWQPFVGLSLKTSMPAYPWHEEWRRCWLQM